MLRFTAAVFFILTLSWHINGQLPGSTPADGENKCGGCPCNNPCAVPSPPPPSPPPPALPPPSSPPPPNKPSSSSSCPPPPVTFPSGGAVIPTPPAQYIYFTGPPGNLYPVDQNFSRAARSFTGGSLLFFGGILVLLALW